MKWYGDSDHKSYIYIPVDRASSLYQLLRHQGHHCVFIRAFSRELFDVEETFLCLN